MRSGLRALSEISPLRRGGGRPRGRPRLRGCRGGDRGRAAGARTLVLERASGGGGTSALSGGVLYLGGGTQLQRACGFEDSPEDMFDYLMASVGMRPTRRRSRLYCEGSVAHYDWIVAQGVPFKQTFYLGVSRRAADGRRPGLVGLGALPALLRRREARAARARAAAPAPDRSRADEAPDREHAGERRAHRGRRARDGARARRRRRGGGRRGVALRRGAQLPRPRRRDPRHRRLHPRRRHAPALRPARVALQGARGRRGRRRVGHPARHRRGRRHAAHGQGLDLAAR